VEGGTVTAARDFLVRKADLKDARIVTTPAPTPGQGEVLLEVERFALTANNITYAAFGDAMQYWQFFPADDAADGRIPVWGFGRVRASHCEGVAEGERFYGYFPMSTHLVVRPERVTPAGFADGAAHRKPLHPVYNQYVNVAADAGYRREHEAQQMLLRPLFTTSFLIDDFLADNGFFGADAVILSSASSKTAWGTAFCLKHQARRVRLIGLTAPANMAFVQALGIYDEVLPYAAVADAAALAAGSAVYVDMSGSADVRAAVHHRLGDRLAHSCAVGGTHWENLGGAAGLPGPRPTLFFAPAQIKKRNADWGAAELQRRIGEAWLALMGRVGEGDGWLKVTEARGDAAVATAYAEMLAGRTAPDAGLILSLNP
jgi:Protein of unknown function (DUF2855)